MFHNSLALDRLSAGCFGWANNGPSFNLLLYDNKLENEYLKLIRNSDNCPFKLGWWWQKIEDFNQCEPLTVFYSTHRYMYRIDDNPTYHKSAFGRGMISGLCNVVEKEDRTNRTY